MKRETMEWLRYRADGSAWRLPDEAAQDILAELKRLRRIERAARRFLEEGSVYASVELQTALKKGGRK